jgi:hypothetical protein
MALGEELILSLIPLAPSHTLSGVTSTVTSNMVIARDLPVVSVGKGDINLVDIPAGCTTLDGGKTACMSQTEGFTDPSLLF